MDNRVKGAIYAALLVVALLFYLNACAGDTGGTQKPFAAMLDRKYEVNADEVMAWIKEGRYEDADAFIDYVVRNDSVTRDGIRYFRAMLEHWLTAREVGEFIYLPPVPQDLLPHIEKWIAHNPDSASAHIACGVYHIERAWEIRGGEIARKVNKESWKPFREHNVIAKQELETAYGLDPDNPHSSRQLMRVQRALDSKDKKATETYFRRATQNHPTFYWAYMSKLTNIKPKWGGDWKTMFAFADETARNAPPKTLLPLVLSSAIVEAAVRSNDQESYLTNKNVWNTLEGIYEQIIEDYPQSSRWKVRFAQVAIYAGLLDKAETYLNLAEKTDPEDGRIYILKGYIADRRNDMAQLERNARLVIKYFPQHPGAYNKLGESLYRQQRLDEAVAVYSRLIELRPDASHGWGMRCTLHKRLEDYPNMVVDCSKAIELNPDHYFSYKLRGFAYEQLGDQKAAEADYEKYDELFKAYKARKKRQG